MTNSLKAQSEDDLPPPPELEPNLFDEIDTNKDGKLSRDEAVAYFLKEEPDAPTPDLDEIWAEEDKDGDGFIS